MQKRKSNKTRKAQWIQTHLLGRNHAQAYYFATLRMNE